MVRQMKLHFQELSFLFFLMLIGFSMISNAQLVQKDAGLSTRTLSSTSTAGGVAVIDINNDGLEDLYFTNRIEKDQLFLNIGYNQFKDITEEAGGFQRTGVLNTLGAKAGDFDNDGFTDLLVTVNIRQGYNLLYRNNGDNTFSEISGGLGPAQEGVDAIILDVNNDALLDIYMLNYVKKGRSTFDENNQVNGYIREGFKNQLFINQGDWKFVDMAESYGLDDEGCSQAGLAIDFDQDGDLDIFSLNDFGEWHIPNKFFINQYPEPRFVEAAAQMGVDAAINSMGVASGDFNRDGLIDFYVTNLGPNLLYKNNGDGTYTEIAEEMNVQNIYEGEPLLAVGWGTVFFDLELDGKDDLFLSNGYIGLPPFLATNIKNRNRLFSNKGSEFIDISAENGVNHPGKSRGAVVMDADMDGDEDLIVTLTNNLATGKREALYYVNEQQGNGNWVKFKLEGTNINRSAIGAEVMIESSMGTRRKVVHGGSSSSSQTTMVLHFGLNDVSMIDKVSVKWPGGLNEEFGEVDANAIYYIKEGGLMLRAGCLDQTADNFDPLAQKSYGCMYARPGCIDKTSESFDPNANVDDGSCNVLSNTEVDDLTFTFDGSTFRINANFRNGLLNLYTLSGMAIGAFELNAGLNEIPVTNNRSILIYRIVDNNNNNIYSGKLFNP